ncbi:MAG: insulinase family protein [Planctomycetes bacterium]|nr:insulinase family protein [Planctomycetota bacterium]
MSKRLVAFLSAGLALVSILHAADEAATRRGKPRAWEHETSDLPVNPVIRFGALDNGVRFAWSKNSEPKQRCYLRIHFDVGSLAEDESERGMAHFLEHMSFNGSTNFPPGTLVEWLQRRGLDFGAHTNAHTSFSETVYMLDLPTSDPQLIREGLTVFRDFADGLLLTQKEVDAEKGVIDGEERERESAAGRLFEQALERQFDGTRLAERLPIGTKVARDAFSAESVRAFWSRWYRPECVTVAVVGDLGEFDPEPLIRELFSGMKVPEAEPLPEPAMGKPTFADVFFALYHPEIPTVSMSVARMKESVDEPATRAIALRDLPLDLAHGMVNLRLNKLARQKEAAFLSASVSDGDMLRAASAETLSVVAEPSKWREAMAQAEQELRRALKFGFQDAELEELRADMLRDLDESVTREATRSSLSFANEIMNAAEERSVPTTASFDRELFGPAIRKVTVEQCAEAIRKAWAEGTLSITAMGGLDLGADGGATLKAAYEDSQKVEVKAGEKIEVEAFAYASKADETGAIASDVVDTDRPIRHVTFENGVRLHVYPTDFKKAQVMVIGLLGHGGLTAGDAALRMVAGEAYGSTGVAEHDEDELRRLTAGRVVGVGFDVSEDAFTFGGATTSADLLFQLELLSAYLEHPSWRETALDRFRKQIPQLYEMMRVQPTGPMTQKFLPALFDGDWRFRMPTLEEVNAIGMERVKGWLEPQLARAPFSVCIVGDVVSDEVVSAAARTIGRLGKRDAVADDTALRTVPTMKSGVHMEETIPSEIQKALVHVQWPAPDGFDAKTRRQIGFLGRVLNDRVRLEVRERLGASYSPRGSAQASLVYKNAGTLSIQAEGDPMKAKDLLDACLATAEKLAKDGVTDDEVERLRTPLLAALRDQQRQNAFWAQTLAALHHRKDALTEIATAESDYLAIDGAAMSKLAAQYLVRDKASSLTVLPAAPAN